MTTKRTHRLPGVLFGLAFTAVAASAPAQDDGARDLVKRMQEAAPKAAFLAKGKLSSDRGWTRELELSHRQLNNNVEASYMEVTAPMDLKDTRFLVFDHATGRDEQFIYVPAAKRAVQVGAQTRKQAFLGSEFYVGDFVHPDPDDFTYRFVGEEDVLGRHCKLVEAVPKQLSDELLYSKTITAVDPTDLLALKTQCFDEKGKLLKVSTVETVEKIDGVWTVLRQQMTNVQENHWTRLELTEIKYNAQLPDEVFNRSYLIR